MNYGPNWKKIKEAVRRRDQTCTHCGKTPEENGRALDVHHINPFRFSNDNSAANLEALCRSCHMRANDHGRRGSAKFLRTEAVKRPAKREIRRLQQLVRATEGRARRSSRRDRAAHLRSQGLTLRAIGRELGVSRQTILHWLTDEMERSRRNGQRSRETSRRRAFATNMRAEGKMVAEIARELEISKQSVAKLLRQAALDGRTLREAPVCYRAA